MHLESFAGEADVEVGLCEDGCGHGSGRVQVRAGWVRGRAARGVVVRTAGARRADRLWRGRAVQSA